MSGSAAPTCSRCQNGHSPDAKTCPTCEGRCWRWLETRVAPLMTPDPPRPTTPREALLMIRLEIAIASRVFQLDATRNVIDRIAIEGLRPTDPATFELTDQLADRLAEAHALLIALRDSGIVDPDALAECGGDVAGLALGRELESRLHEVLALPPDLEAMVERRIRS